MKIQALTIGLRVRHPQHGVGTVKSISERTADLRFDDGLRTVDPELSEITPAEPGTSLAELNLPLQDLIQLAVETTLDRMGYAKRSAIVDQLGPRWHKGKALLHQTEPSPAPKEVPMEVLFQKVVGIRDELRELERQINRHTILTSSDKAEMQQYISRCYGSLTTFNLLFKDKEDQFSS